MVTSLSCLENQLALSAQLVSDDKLSLASSMLEIVRLSLSEAVVKKDPWHQNEPKPPKSDPSIKFIPIANNACAEPWETDFFPFPIIFQMKNRTFASLETYRAKREFLYCCSAACLFNLGLCLHLQNTERAAIEACDYYLRAWYCLEHSAVKPWESSMLLSTALCMNLSSCLQYLGQLDSARSWINCLTSLLAITHPNCESISPEIRKFFFVATILNTRGVAAPSA